MRKLLNDKKISQMIEHHFELVESALLTNDYNLIWKKWIITEGFWQWSMEKENHRCNMEK